MDLIDRVEEDSIMIQDQIKTLFDKFDNTANPIYAQHLQDALKHPNWLAGRCFGQIVWQKSLGRPATPTLRDGFEINAGRYQPVIDQNGDIENLFAAYQASWSDGKDNDDKWRVNYMLSGVKYDAVSEVTIRFKPGTAWSGINTIGIRVITPGHFGFKRSEMVILPSVTIVNKPFFL